MYNFRVIGNPIRQSKSPLLFNEIFNKLKLQAQYKAQNIKTQNELSVFMKDCKSQNIRGANITMPLKEKIYPYVTNTDNIAQMSNVVNCIYFQDDKIIGYNNDYYGFNKLLEINEVNIENSNNIILGSGGSARTVILSLIKHRAKNIYILSRNIETAHTLIKDMLPYAKKTHLKIFTNSANFKTCNLMNCTPIGMLEKTDITIISELPKINYDFIIDINYNHYYNYFTQKAKKRIDGKSMFIFQALKSLDIWFESNISDKLSYQELEKIIC